MTEAPECGHHRGQRKLQQHRAHRAAEDNQRRRGLQDLAHVAALDQQPGNDAGDGQNDSADARFIHVQLLVESMAVVRLLLFASPSCFGFAAAVAG